MIEEILANYNYWIYVVLMMIGFYAVIAKSNLVKKVIGLNIFSTAIFLFYISIGDIREIPGKIVTEPIYMHGENLVYVNPIPHVLILTGIVVSVSVTAVASALIIKIYKEFGTIEEEKILEMQS
ncbi:MAG TPA: cation:proton antiporter subunit C [Candidatus Nanoarchaeia archaeon]|nr:cation:proton antiporter subunit C [Candidatus Nanoarchaeia archaeon]